MNALRTDRKTLLIGIGNSGRSDDALGWKFADEFSHLDSLFDIEYRYQLQIEDAELVSHYENVIFADASRELSEEGFSFQQCLPKQTTSFTSHKLSPGSILWLSRELFNSSPHAAVLAIEGSEWELRQGISDYANRNLSKAVNYFRQALEGEKK